MASNTNSSKAVSLLGWYLIGFVVVATAVIVIW